MADTFTPSLRIQLMTTGGDSGIWGTIANTQFASYEAAITGDNGFLGGTGGIDLTGLTTYTLTANNGIADQARELLYPFIGTISAPCTVTIPGVVKIGWTLNTTGQNVILTTGGSGANLTLLPNLGWTFFYCDGTNVTAPQLSLGSLGPTTVNGNTTLNGNVVANAATFQSVATVGAANVGGLATVNSLRVVSGVTTLTGEGSTSVLNAGALSNQNVTFGNNGPVNYSLSAVGAIIAAAYYAISDRRAKTEIAPITPEAGADWIMRGEPVTFKLKGVRSSGFIAQDEITRGRGDAVIVVPNDDPAFAESDGVVPAGHRLMRKYEHDTAYFTAALQYAFARIAALEKQLET